MIQAEELTTLRNRANNIIDKLSKEISKLKQENRRLSLLLQEAFENSGECGGIHNMD